MFSYTHYFQDDVLVIEFQSTPLDPQTPEEALALSIAKWVYIAEVLKRLIASYGDVAVDLWCGSGDTCALCQYYYSDWDCHDCVVGNGCKGTPYIDFMGAQTLSAGIHAARAEAAFLKGLE